MLHPGGLLEPRNSFRYLPTRPVRYPARWSHKATVRDSIPASRNVGQPALLLHTVVECAYSPVSSDAREGQQTEVGTIAFEKLTPSRTTSFHTCGIQRMVRARSSSVRMKMMSGLFGRVL